MQTQPNFADAMAKMIDAYTRSWWAMTQLLGGVPRPGDGPRPPLTDDWLAVARTMKDSFVAAVNTGFDLWEDQCRRAMRQWQPPPRL
jgi:hypothetical protein